MEDGAEDALKQLWLGYTESLGHSELRTEISRLYNHITRDQILVHTGAEEAIFNFLNVTLTPDDHVIVHWPGYQSLFEVAKSIGCQVTRWQTFPEDKWELDFDFLRQHLKPNTKLVIVNCPHNPTGYQMTKSGFQELVSLSQKHGFLIFSDEVYRYLEYAEDDMLPALCDIDARGISLGVMSKSFGLAGLRIGWIATQNTDVLNRLAQYKDYTTICNSAPSEYLATTALKHKNQILTRNQAIVQQNLGILNRFFERYPDTIKWIPPQAGPIAFPKLRIPHDADTFCQDLVTKSGVLLLPGSCYDANYNAHFRIGFGRQNMPECIEKLETYLNQQGLS
jgi:aspartate/methionine/tyrosine aminotransferase